MRLWSPFVQWEESCSIEEVEVDASQLSVSVSLSRGTTILAYEGSALLIADCELRVSIHFNAELSPPRPIWSYN